jgi:hypothetical protein
VRGERLQRLIDGGDVMFIPVTLALVEELRTWTGPVLVRIEPDEADELIADLVVCESDTAAVVSR